jgi:uncharacterized tellurite resistance protein B-like protein
MTDAATLQSLAYLYIAFGHATDDALTTEEMRTLAAHLQAWVPDEDLEALGAALKAGMTTYRSKGSRRDKIAGALDIARKLAASLPAEQLPKIHDDLRSIAAADGSVSDEETKMIDAIAKVMAG